MIRLIAKFLKVLNSEAAPGQISGALALAMVAGLTPLLSLHNLAVVFFVLVLRVNLSAFIGGVLLFSGFAYALDPIFHLVGMAVLTAGPLEGLWTAMYNSTLFRVASFNNTIVMGSLVFSIIAFAPAYFLFNGLIVKYRESVLDRMRKTRIAGVVRASRIYNVYTSLSGLGGGR